MKFLQRFNSFLEKGLERFFFPIENTVLENYSLKVENQSALAPIIRARFIEPFIFKLSTVIAPIHLSLLSLIIAFVIYILSTAVSAQYAVFNFPTITLLLGLYLIISNSTSQLALFRQEKNLFSEFLDRYISSFSIGFIAIATVFLFASWQRELIPLFLISLYSASYAFFLAHRDTGVIRIERYGQNEALAILGVLALVSTIPPFQSFLANTTIAGLSLYDLVLLLTICGGVGMAATYLLRDKLYFTVDVLLYVSACILLYIISYQTEDPILSSTLLVVYHADLIGRVILARMGHSGSVLPRIIPLLLTIVATEIEPFVWYSYWHLSPVLLYGYLVICNALLAIYAFIKLK